MAITFGKGSTRNESVGNYSSHHIHGQVVVIETENARVEVIVYDDGIIRFRISKVGQEFSGFSYAVSVDPKTAAFKLSETNEQLLIRTNLLELRVSKKPLRFEAYTLAGELISADDPAFGTSWLGNEVTTYKKLQPDERFIGLGEKTGNLDRRGQTYVNWNTDSFAYAVDADPIYLSTPFYMGLHGKVNYGIFFDNSHKTTFNFGCSNDRFSYFQAEDGEMNYYLIYNPTVAGIIERYTWLTGKMELPPLWSLGFQQCRYSYYPYTEVLNAARTFREKDIPADVLYLDIHYMEAYKVFTWDQKRFPDPKKLMADLKEMGFNMVVIMDPGVKKEVGYHAYDDGKKKQLFVQYPDGEEFNGQVWPGWSAFPDFTNEEARTWWADQMSVLTENGVEGFWNDMNEPAAWGQHLPDLIEFDYEGEGGTHKKARNVYGMQMARSTFEGGKKLLGGKRPFVLTRAGYSGIQRYAAVWTGDNVSTDEHMLAGVRLVNSMGLTGISNAGYDVGGFAGEATPDLFARWISLGAFSPFFRSHSMVNSRDSEPWSFGEEVEDISRNYIKLRYRLMPYLYSVFYESTQNGMPVSRSLAIDYTFDPFIYSDPYQNQYLFGPSLLVIPAESYKQFIKAYFPEGAWYSLYTDSIQAGGTEEIIDNSKEYLPVYVKAGSILLMQEATSNLLKQQTVETLEIHIYPGGNMEFDYYEDDGETYRYLDGQNLTRKFKLQEKNLHISDSCGSHHSHFKNWIVYVHGSGIHSITINGVQHQVEYTNYRFVQPVSDFDPYHKPPQAPVEIEHLAMIRTEAITQEVLIEWA
jgi:alpha-glucosidase